MDITITLIYQPIFNLIVFFYRLLGENLGLAIILVALLSRLVTLPIIIRQRKTMVKNREFTEKMNQIKEKHKHDKETQQKKMMELQSEYLPSQLAGCLPAIIQLIVFINIYNVIRSLITSGASAFNSYAYPFVGAFKDGYNLNYSFLGIFDLSKQPAEFANNIGQFIPYIILLILVAATQYYSMRLTMAMTMPAVSPQPAEEGKKKKDKKKNDKDEPKPEDFGAIVQQSTKQTMLLFPLLYVFISYSLPSGLALYWIMQSGFVIIQQLLINRFYKEKPKAPVIDGEAVEASAILTE